MVASGCSTHDHVCIHQDSNLPWVGPSWAFSVVESSYRLHYFLTREGGVCTYRVGLQKAGTGSHLWPSQMVSTWVSWQMWDVYCVSQWASRSAWAWWQGSEDLTFSCWKTALLFSPCWPHTLAPPFCSHPCYSLLAVPYLHQPGQNREECKWWVVSRLCGCAGNTHVVVTVVGLWLCATGTVVVVVVAVHLGWF